MEEINLKKDQPESQRERSKAKRRAAIIEVATQTFLENGYEATTMTAIAQRMGGSKGTLWSYFTTKDELLAAVIDYLSSAFQLFMGMILDTEQDMVVTLTKFCETFIERISRPEAIALQRMVLSQADRSPHVARIFHERGPAVNHRMVANFLGRQMLAGVIPVDSPEEAARMLLDLCTAGYHDMVFYGFQTQDTALEKEQAARVVKQFMRCYGPAELSKGA